jgi:Family of unknown function (DUF695)/Regulator of ribonuclease activity B
MQIEATYYRDGALVLALGFGLENDLEIASAFPWLVETKIFSRTRDENGFPTPQEQPAILKLTDRLIQVWDQFDTQHVARISTNGTRTFYDYAKSQDIVLALQAACREFPEYRVEVTSREDTNLNFYRNEILPLAHYNNQIALLKIVLKTLHENGDDLKQSRPFDHTSRFPTLESAETFANWARQAGFMAELPRLTKGQYHVDLTKDQIPDSQLVYGTLYELVMASHRFGGVYESNGCSAVISKPDQVNKESH